MTPTPETPAAVALHGIGLMLDGVATIHFHRTLRVPEEGEWPLPAGLGYLPLTPGTSLLDTAPPAWRRRDVTVVPMYRQEAMWLSFSTVEPVALQVAVGGRCALTGEPHSDRLSQDPQNYVVLPAQPWLDGMSTGEGVVSQFVAVPRGSGASVEAQLTGAEERGGMQFEVWRLTESARRAWLAEQARNQRFFATADMAYDGAASAMPMAAAAPEMGIGAGGSIRQEVYADSRPLSDYEAAPRATAEVQLVDAAAWPALAGSPAPPTPITIDAYTRAGIPWFGYHDSARNTLSPGGLLRRLRKTGEWLRD